MEQEPTSLTSQIIDRDHLEQTLAQFTDLWDALYPGERCRLVRTVIETIEYHDKEERPEIRFRLTGNLATSDSANPW